MKQLLFLTLVITSCQTADEANKNNSPYSYRFDTAYQTNSTKIDAVSRTFFMIGDYSDDYLKMSKTIGKDSYGLTIMDDKEIGAAAFTQKELDKFFSDVDTLRANPTKGLRYTFSYGGSVSSDMDGIRIYASTGRGGSSGFVLRGAEVDSMKACYKRYLAEK